MKPRDAERRQRQQRRQALYHEVHDLYEKTRSIRAIAARLGIDRRTVRKYLDAPECPQPKPRGSRPSILDPYRDYILARWAEGCLNTADLYGEIVQQDYLGSRMIVKDFVATLRRRTQGEPVVRCVRDPGGFVYGSPARRRNLTRTNSVSSTWSWRRYCLRGRRTPSCKSSEGF